jgi:hypothetical protein
VRGLLKGPQVLVDEGFDVKDGALLDVLWFDAELQGEVRTPCTGVQD